MKTYDYPAPYGYDSDSLAARGSERANQIQALPHASPVRTTLEFGCGDGMVSAALEGIGIGAIDADISDHRFDDRAREAGVRFHHCDAAGIPAIPDGAVDCVFSYNAFEHVQDPEAVLNEMSRIVRPGGLIYLSFGPLYYSAFGEHAYRSIPIPYCQFLFQIETMNQFCRDRGLEEIDPHHVNRWSLQNYRELWDKFGSRLERVSYIENPSVHHIGLIRSYPSCFKNKSANALDFVVSDIKVIFKKKSS
jgi:SAM-dependent methyltransferase